MKKEPGIVALKKKPIILNAVLGGFDADYQAILNYAISQGYGLPSAINQSRQNTLLVALKSAGIWSELDVFYNFLTDGSASFAKINWKAPGTLTATDISGGLSFTANMGFGVNGTGVLNTGYVPTTGTNWTLNNAGHFGDVEYLLNAVSLYYWGSVGANANAALTFQPRVSAVGGQSNAQANIANVATGPVGSGFNHIHQRGSGIGLSMYKDGVQSFNSTGLTGNAEANMAVYIGGRNNNGVTEFGVSGGRIYCWGAGSSMGTKEIALNNAWLAYANPIKMEVAWTAITTYATSQSITLPSASVAAASKQLILDLMNANVWHQLDVFYNFWTEDSTFSRINWRQPGLFGATLVGSPTFTAKAGWQSNAPTTNNLLTGYTPSTNGGNLALNFCSIFGWVNTEAALATAIDFGTSNVAQTGFLTIGARNASSQSRMSNNAVIVLGAGGVSSSIGLFHSRRRGSAATHFSQFLDGVDIDSANNASAAIPDQQVRILAGQDAAGAASNGSTRQVSMVGIGSWLYGNELGLYNAWNAYKTTVGT